MNEIEFSDGAREWLLSIADDKHLMGQQHAEWIGIAPFLEEDLAFASIGQDELRHAAWLYQLIAGDDDAAIDQLAFGRAAGQYRSCHLVEFATDDWATAFVRHWIFDLADAYRIELLASSTLEVLRHIAARIQAEERFHRLHSQQMLDVLLADPTAARRITKAVEQIAPLVPGMFDGVAGEVDAIVEGLTAAPFIGVWPSVRAEIEERVGAVDWGGTPEHGRRTVRSPNWQPMMSRMREVIALDVEAVW